MLRQFGRRGTIAAAVVALVTFFALLNALQPFSPLKKPPSVAKGEETADLEKEAFAADGEHREEQHTPVVKVEETAPMVDEHSTGHEPAGALIDGAKAAPEKQAGKSEGGIADETSTRTWPSREFPEPTPSGPSKVVVMGKMEHEDTEWVHQLSDWGSAVYCVDLAADAPCASGLKTKMNKGKEAMPYLTYLIDHYADLPDVMAFVHAHRSGMPQAWHNDAPRHDAVRMLRDLRPATVLARGYANLRCIPDIGCPDEVRPFRAPPDDARHAEHAFPYFYAHFFGATFEEMRADVDVVATPCCAQFAVSREQVRKRELAFYERVRRFLEETHYDDDTSGRVMEYMWHIIFGRDAVHCDDMFECWCQVFGRCSRWSRNQVGQS